MRRVAYIAFLLASSPAWSSELEIRVVDRNGAPVPDVVVTVDGTTLAVDESKSTAVMDQVNEAFSPHILAVRQGTSVEFPNKDPVAHHVYSFSKPNDFTLPLYKGEQHESISFDHNGVVVVGCNIHDNMLGYILVIDSPVFGMTDAEGIVSLPVGDATGDAVVRIWSPRIRDKGDVTESDVTLQDQSTVKFKLVKRLRPEHVQESWSDY